MRVCINYFGQIRDMNITIETFNNFIKESVHETHILYSTWDDENIELFKNYFHESYIKTYQKPDLSEPYYNNIIQNYTMDYSNPNKTIEHYLLGLYIKSKSKNTIEHYEKEKNIKFDIIVSLRTSVYLFDKHISCFYNDIYESGSDYIYTAYDPCYNIHNEIALPDVIFIGKEYSNKKALDQVSILEKCKLYNQNVFHPETSFAKSLQMMGLVIKKLNFRAFPQII